MSGAAGTSSDAAGEVLRRRFSLSNGDSVHCGMSALGHKRPICGVRP